MYRLIFLIFFWPTLLKRNDSDNVFPCVFPCVPHAHAWHHTMGETGENWGGKVLSLFKDNGALKLVMVSYLICIFTGFWVSVRNIRGGKVFHTL